MSDIDDRVMGLLSTFEQAKDPCLLERAAELVEGLSVGEGQEPRERQARRAHKLRLWLNVLNHLDRQRDPGFDFADVPELAVAPPVAPGAVSLTGMDAKDMENPVLRREY